MRSLIEKVVFGKLNKTTHDRKGIIATFYLKQIPNDEHARFAGVEIIQLISALISDMYNSFFDEKMRGRLGEQNHSFISLGEHLFAVRLRHKYWSDGEIEAFKGVVRALATLHKWEVSEEE